MTPEEAIEYLEALQKTLDPCGYSSEAIQLGIEALEREQERREQGQAWKPLPSETEE